MNYLDQGQEVRKEVNAQAPRRWVNAILRVRKVDEFGTRIAQLAHHTQMNKRRAA